MPSLSVGGTTIPVAVSSPSWTRMDQTDRSRAFDGTFRASQTGGAAREWDFATPPVTQALAETYKAALSSPASTLCSGDILQLPTMCSPELMGGTPVRTGSGHNVVLTFKLHESQASRVLLRYSPGDVITGESFTGPANRTYLDTNQAVRYAAVNIKRDGHFPASGVRSLLLEGARTNVIIRAEEFDNAAWVKSSAGAGSVPVVTANDAGGPDGNVVVEKVVFVAPAAGDNSLIFQNPTVVNATAYSGTVYVKAFAAGDVGKVLVYRQVGGSTYSLLTLSGVWQRLGNTETSTSTAGNFEIGLRPDQGGSTGTVSIHIWAGQLEAGAFASSYIPTTTVAVARTTESYQLPLTFPPQELTVYVKGVEAGTLFTGGAEGLFALGGSTNASLFVLNGSGSGKYQVLHRTASDVTSTAAATPALGDLVELRVCLYGDGSVQLGQAINSGVEVVAAQSAANPLATSWLTQIAYIGDRNGSTGFFAFQAFKIAAGSRSLAEMRGL